MKFEINDYVKYWDNQEGDAYRVARSAFPQQEMYYVIYNEKQQKGQWEYGNSLILDEHSAIKRKAFERKFKIKAFLKEN